MATQPTSRWRCTWPPALSEEPPPHQTLLRPHLLRWTSLPPSRTCWLASWEVPASKFASRATHFDLLLHSTSSLSASHALDFRLIRDSQYVTRTTRRCIALDYQTIPPIPASTKISSDSDSGPARDASAIPCTIPFERPGNLNSTRLVHMHPCNGNIPLSVSYSFGQLRFCPT